MLISKSNSFYIIRQLKKFTLNLLEVEYLNRQSLWFDLKILLMTLLKVIKRDGVSH